MVTGQLTHYVVANSQQLLLLPSRYSNKTQTSSHIRCPVWRSREGAPCESVLEWDRTKLRLVTVSLRRWGSADLAVETSWFTRWSCFWSHSITDSEWPRVMLWHYLSWIVKPSWLSAKSSWKPLHVPHCPSLHACYVSVTAPRLAHASLTVFFTVTMQTQTAAGFPLHVKCLHLLEVQ